MNINKFTGEHRYLSNFYPCVVEMDGKKYPSTEHAYQAAKTLDKSKRKVFQAGNSISAGKAKREGRKLKIRKDWESIKVDIMHELLLKKFARGPLMEELLATGESQLIEGNTWGDTFWGVCRGKGKNWLGKLLMQVRAVVRERSSSLRV